MAATSTDRALVIGFFSTVGDLEVLRQVERQLDAQAVPHDVAAYDPAVRARLDGAIDLHAADPARYTHLCVVCGPFDRAFFTDIGFDLDRFAHCTRVGVNLTMVADLDDWDPLDALVGRDSNRWTLPDLSLREQVERVPVVGLCLARNQPEYGDRVRHAEANEILRRVAARAGAATVEVDTEWPAEHNTAGLRSPAEFESLCARFDLLLTTRLHGTVIALKNGVPVVALDAIAGGGKVTRQATAIGWPEIFAIDTVDDAALDAAVARCLAPDGRQRALACAADARRALDDFPSRLAAALAAPAQGRPAATAVPPWLWTLRQVHPARVWRLGRARVRRMVAAGR